MDRRPLKIDLDNVIYGIHAVEEALDAGEELKHVHVSDERRRDPALRKIVETAYRRSIPVRTEERRYFAQFPYKAHQGVVAFGPPFEYASLEDVLARPRSGPLLLVILDHITDPHNAGAIIRTAECAGAHAVIVPERRAAGVNATVRKSAAGATAHVPVVRVSNVADTIRRVKKARIWVAGASLSERGVDYTAADFTVDLALVIGAEGEGLGQLVARECDYLVTIPIKGKVASLNASVAAGVLLYETVRQRARAAAAP